MTKPQPATVTAEQYGQLCDVVERAWQHWPTEHDEENPHNHTSDYARNAAKAIMAILGLEPGPIDEVHLQRIKRANPGAWANTKRAIREEDAHSKR
jgi:hypothetical protein